MSEEKYYDKGENDRLTRMSQKQTSDYWNEDKRAFKQEELEYELEYEDEMLLREQLFEQMRKRSSYM